MRKKRQKSIQVRWGAKEWEKPLKEGGRGKKNS